MENEPQASSLPLVLITVSLLVWFGFQTAQLLVERSELNAVKVSFEGATQESQKIRDQLEALITKTTELAGQGNASARSVVEELEKRGIPIRAIAQP